ncbi:hypothetical protein [Streptomyces sp. NPDC005374]|uniref:hypothetical protein n=1 Tax=Streptomyces sp. NPDC005374 TaxID=3364713 RepID=UPI00368E07FC
MRRTRIEKQRRPARARRHPDEAYGVIDDLDPRDPDIVRAKRLLTARNGGTHRLQNLSSPSRRPPGGGRERDDRP